MENKDLKKLLSQKEQPSISLYIPTSQLMSDRLQDPIRVKNSVDSCLKQIAKKYPSSLEKLAQNLNNLLDKLDYTKTLNTLIFFVSENTKEFFMTRFHIDETIMVDDQFYLVPVVEAINNDLDYWVLAISHDPTRLFRGKSGELEEIHDDKFPYRWLYQVTNDSVFLAYQQGDRDASYDTALRRKFMQDVEKHLTEKLALEHMPIILLGTEKNISEFGNSTKHKNNIIISKHGDYAHTPAHEIKLELKPLIKDYIKQKYNKIALNQAAEEAIDNKKYVQGLEKITQAAAEGRIHELIIELNINTKNKHDVVDTDNANTMPNLETINRLVNKTIETDGKIIFVEQNLLEDRERMFAILRW